MTEHQRCISGASAVCHGRSPAHLRLTSRPRQRIDRGDDVANNGWHLWGASSGSGSVWDLVGLAVLAWLIWANWDAL